VNALRTQSSKDRRVPTRRLRGLVVAAAAFGVVVAATLAPPAHAQRAGATVADPEPGSIGLGIGYRFGNSPYRNVPNISSDANNGDTDLVPLYLYEGRRFYARGSWVGVRVAQQPSWGLDLIARYRFDRLEAVRQAAVRQEAAVRREADSFYEGMADREQTVDGGLSLYLRGALGELSLAAVTDLASRHQGAEYDLTYRYPLTFGNWVVSPYASLVHQDSDLVDYYYGVRREEARPDRPFYRAGSGTFWRYGVDTAFRLSRGWRLHGSLGMERLPGAVRDSPLTNEERLFTAFAGTSYFFPTLYDTRSLRPDRDATWAWRVNAGYTADANFYKVLQGAFRRADEADTHLAGFTVGRLVQDHGRARYWGRFSVNRRFQGGNQSDFFEYVGYAMAMRHVNSPWSDRELLRVGFGAGFSYADKVPWVERVKQERRDLPTSRLLNYLEAQLDFPLRNWVGGGPLERCYLGMTIVHRSGMFATSDLLGNVAGGSNVVTGHLECGL
jgi:MipA family protein